MEAVFMPPPMLMMTISRMGNKAVAGNRSGDLGEGLGVAREPRMEADGDAGGNGPSQGKQQGDGDAQEGGGGRVQGEGELGAREMGEQHAGFEHRVKSKRGDGKGRERLDDMTGARGGGPGRVRVGMVVGEIDDEALGKRGDDAVAHGTEDGGVEEHGQQRRTGWRSGFDLLELELIGPDNERAPEKLVEQNDDCR